MAGVGKILKEAQKMQRKVEEAQQKLAALELTVSGGGGAVKVKVNGQQDLLALEIDPEFLKEEADVVAETIRSAVKEALAKSKKASEEEMGKATAGFQLPGMGL